MRTSAIALAPDRAHKYQPVVRHPRQTDRMDWTQTTPAPSIPGECIFCGNRDDLTCEHFFPAWLNKSLRHDHHFAIRKLNKWGLGQSRKAQGWGSTISAPRDIVCRDCNNGWMSDLEERVKPLIITMLGGRSLSLTRTDQIAFARWATMKSVVWDGDHDLDRQGVSQRSREDGWDGEFGASSPSIRAHLRTRDSPPDSVVVKVAALNRFEARIQHSVARPEMRLATGEIDWAASATWLTAWQIGHLAVRVHGWTETGIPPSRPDILFSAHQLWPLKTNNGTFPPMTTAGSFEHFYETPTLVKPATNFVRTMKPTDCRIPCSSHLRTGEVQTARAQLKKLHQSDTR